MLLYRNFITLKVLILLCVFFTVGKSKMIEYTSVVHKENFKLIEPPLEQRKGAISGVTIMFQLISKERGLKYTLVDPPKGMKFIEDYSTGGNYLASEEFVSVDVEWKVPMDAVEGKTYNIIARATDLDGSTTEITFPIKVPKTTPMQTKIINNELTIIDKSSNLYGMKMKGHSGEDISELKLRSIEYGDIKKHPSNQYEVNHKLKYTAFIIDNKPPKLNIDLPDILYFGFYKYSVGYIGDSDPWDDIAPSYLIDAKDAWDSATGRYIIKNNVKGVPQRNEYDDGGNKVYLLVVEDKGV